MVPKNNQFIVSLIFDERISKAKKNKLVLFLKLISLVSSKLIRIKVDKIIIIKIKPPKYSDKPYTKTSTKDVFNLGPRSFIIIH